MAARTVGSRLSRLTALLACAAALACGVKAPPRPPERAGQPGSGRSAPASGAADGGAACGGAACGGEAPDGGAERP